LAICTTPERLYHAHVKIYRPGGGGGGRGGGPSIFSDWAENLRILRARLVRNPCKRKRFENENSARTVRLKVRKWAIFGYIYTSIYILYTSVHKKGRFFAPSVESQQPQGTMRSKFTGSILGRLSIFWYGLIVDLMLGSCAGRSGVEPLGGNTSDFSVRHENKKKKTFFFEISRPFMCGMTWYLVVGWHSRYILVSLKGFWKKRDFGHFFMCYRRSEMDQNGRKWWKWGFFGRFFLVSRPFMSGMTWYLVIRSHCRYI
jgi:hypothetical protein